MLALRPGLRRRTSLRGWPCPHVLAAALLVAPAVAAGEEDVRLGTVTVTADAEAPPPEPTVAEEPTGFGTVVETKDFAGQQIDVADLLLHAPGTRIHRAPGGATLRLRGSSSEQSLVLLDGIALNAAAGGGVDLRTIPAALLERITVLRGNEGARYGSGALGGAALLETRALRDEVGGSVRLSAGSFDSYAVDGAAWGGTGAATGLAAITYRDTSGAYEGLYDPTPEANPGDRTRRTVENNDATDLSALLKGRLDLGEGTVIHALALGSLGSRGLAGTYYFPDDHRRDEWRLLTALRIEGDPHADVRLFGGVELRHDEVAVWSDRPACGVLCQPFTDDAGKPWQIENVLLARTGAELAPTGWTLLHAEVALGSEWLRSPYHADRQRERVALSLGDELYLGSSVTVAPALRWEKVGKHEGLSPRIGVAWRPLEAIELRSNWGRTFRAPSLGELYFEQAGVKANPALDPESGWTVDGGAVLRLPRTLVQLTGFYSRIEDLILYELAGAMVSKPANFDDAEIRGGEVELSLQPLRQLTVGGSYSLAQTRNLRDAPHIWKKELPYRPAHRLHLRAVYRADGYEAFASASHQSEQFINRTNTFALPEATTVSAGAGVRLVSLPWTLWLSGQIDNAFDAPLVDQLGYPQAGRAFTLTLRAQSPEGGARSSMENNE
ncbi:TonB-dependent receptor plug domain-containing protein [Vulgatibacter sp.]|uniref:TonB-dependent receptor plug domain-containing protein n=1 Tax=Vulgatibacter sp. TaxID=1971226 RepID=UPI003564E4B0